MKIINKNIAMKIVLIILKIKIVLRFGLINNTHKEQHELRDFGKQRFIDNDKLIDIVKKHI